MKDYQDSVFDFHFKNGIPYRISLKRPCRWIRFLLWTIKCCLSFYNKKSLKWSKSNLVDYKEPTLYRLHLILDEVEEITEALMIGDLESLADATTDLLYVTFGMQVVYFIPSKEVFDEVHRTNLTKDFKSKDRRKYKGKNWTPPNIGKAIAEGRLRQIEEYKNAYNRRFGLSGKDNISE